MDCANGVGALWVQKYLDGKKIIPLELTVLNDQIDKGELLNNEVLFMQLILLYLIYISVWRRFCEDPS